MGEGAVHPGNLDGAIQVGNLRRVYHLHVPPSYDGTTPLPLVLVFHGFLEDSQQMVTLTGFSQLADEKGFIVTYPESIGRAWNDGRGTTSLAPKEADDVGFIEALIAHLKQTLAIDPQRIYATGMSNGGMFVQRLACELSDTIAAIGPVSGTMPQNVAAHCGSQQQVSVVEFHGTHDAFVTWDGEVRALGGKVLSVPNTMARWAQVDGCHAAASSLILESDREARGHVNVQRVGYGPCQHGTDVVLYVIEGGRHNWPEGVESPPALMGRGNHAMTVAHVMWDFFEAHPKLPQASIVGTRSLSAHAHHSSASTTLLASHRP